MFYDFVIRNGHVMDPSRGIDNVENVYIYNSKIVEKPQEGVTYEVGEFIDAKGYLVLPGLIDHHTHLGHHCSDLGVNPDLHLLPNGVTAANDAGTAGPSTIEALLLDSLHRSTITAKVYMSLASGGIPTDQYIEPLDPELYDIKLIEYIIEKYDSDIIGFKSRVGRRHSKDLDLKPLEGAITVGEKFNKRVNVHVTNPISGYDVICNMLRKGDIFCHCLQEQGDSLIDTNGKIQEAVLRARERGVLFDAATGRMHHSFAVARKVFAEGFYPDLISTDIVAASVYRKNVFSLPFTIAKFKALGMPLYNIIEACTATPARIMGLEQKIGTLSVGADADVAIFKIVEKKVDFQDLYGNKETGNMLLIPQMTIKAGRIAYRTLEFSF